MKKFLIMFLLLCILAISGVVYFVYTNMQPVTTGSDAVTFLVARGESLSTISLNLYNKNLIRNDSVFKYYGVYNKYDLMLKEGEYDISSSLSIDEIYNILIEGKQDLISVTIPEGYTSRKIAKILEDSGVVNSKDFLEAVSNKDLLEVYNIPFDSAEGFLFPDTYSFQENYPALFVVESFLNNFFKNIKAIYPSYTKLTRTQLADKVILASIVEREYKSRTEVKTIASVFYNRLETGMKLQSCATVMYVLTEELGEEHRDRLLFEDLEIESEFNTYIIDALPPSAISNPGFNALNAVFFPEETEYIYFVVKDRANGLHRFTSKYSDHEAARLDYLSGFESKQ